MECIHTTIGGELVIISLYKTDFACPYCKEPYNDNDERYLNRWNKGLKQGYITITCRRCKERFGMSYDCTGDAVSFDL